MKLYTRQNGILTKAEYNKEVTVQEVLDLINVKHIVIRELKGIGITPDKGSPVLTCIMGGKTDYDSFDSPSVA